MTDDQEKTARMLARFGGTKERQERLYAGIRDLLREVAAVEWSDGFACGVNPLTKMSDNPHRRGDG